MPAPTFGWLDIPAYRGWAPGDPDQKPKASFLDDGIAGERLRLSGTVRTRSGAPLNKVRIEFWHADPAGAYHMETYKLRGAQGTKTDGSFMLETIMPGAAGTIRHIRYIATANIEGRKQPLVLCAAVHFATDEELARSVAAADKPYVRPGTRKYRDDPAYLALSALPVADGVREATYDIVFDIA